MRFSAVTLVTLWSCISAGRLAAREPSRTLLDFDGPDPLASWRISADPEPPGIDRWLTIGAGHSGRGAVLEYRFTCEKRQRCGGAVTILWKPAKPVPINRKGAISFWIRAAAEVRVTLLTQDKDEGLRRYPFEGVSLENAAIPGWRRVVVPLAAKSTGYWDESHTGKPEGRLTALGFLVESRFPQAMHGSMALDDVTLLESPNQTFEFDPDAVPVAPPPGSEHLRSRLGVNIHVLNDDSALDRARDAGFSFVRVDLLWRQVERNGRYRFQPYDRLLSALQSRGLGALWILDYGHPLHGGDPPRQPDSVAAFARYAEAAALHFKGSNSRFEIWNEPDTARFWPPKPDAREYAVLLAAATAAMRRVDPEARIASGGTSGVDAAFLRAIFDAVQDPKWNVAAVHPYRRLAPETFAPDLSAFRQFLSVAGFPQFEVWDTEWGYASYDYFSRNLRGDGHSSEGRHRQAVLAIREALTAWALGVPVAAWYDLRDDGDDPRNPEHNYGLLDSRGMDKPAMSALRKLTEIADNHTYSGMLPDAPDGAHVMRLSGGKDNVFAIWSDQPDARMTVHIPAQKFVSAANLVGEPVKAKQSGRGVEFMLPETDGPIFLTFSSH